MVNSADPLHQMDNGPLRKPRGLLSVSSQADRQAVICESIDEPP
ncbi:hypothetical protein RBSH_00145 [Rhodopirellula baltica SH28]|uniref:Uncharacterized protein n=1 Tax=Rhodopirellula baltica SH28 TaxID=993517 RepID=K5CKC6_RHOBT|nr:hypothetical protein RBSH_00145 [Rhodopirellula baltica SH28]